MTKRTWPGLVLAAAGLVWGLGHGVALAAPDDPAPEAPAVDPLAEALKAHDALQKELNDANRAYGLARRDWFKQQQAGEEAGEQPVSPVPELLAKFNEKAQEYAGQEGAVPFLVTVVQQGTRGAIEDAKTALDTLAAQHAESPRLDVLTFTFLYYRTQLGPEKVEAARNRIIEVTPHRAVKGAMLFSRGSAVNRDREATEEQRAAAVADLRSAMELAPETRYGKMAKSTIFELENLQIGMPAPDIEGNDLDGVAFKLSDYRGKVVVLDFWGDW